MRILQAIPVKILCITSRVPWPLEKGDKLRIYHQLRELANRHEVSLFALSDGPVHPEAVAVLKRFCKEVHIHRLTKGTVVVNLFRSLFKGLPFQVGYFTCGSAIKAFRKFAGKVRPDRLYCQLIRTAEYRKVLPQVPAVLDYMDVFSKGVERRIPKEPWWKRWVFRLELKRLLRYEADSFRNFERHTIISRQDRDLLPFKEASAVTVVPNGVDTEQIGRAHV